MRMTKYKLQLVKESGTNYGGKDYQICNPYNLYNMLCDVCNLDKQAEEVLILICLDVKNKVIGIHEVSRGTIDSSLANGREIFKRALLNNAAKIILAHNHPSGNPRPSKEDREVVRLIKESGKMLNINLIDNIIIGDDQYYSFKEYNEL